MPRTKAVSFLSHPRWSSRSERAEVFRIRAVSFSRICLLLAAGAVAGLMNAIAGGGTIVTFPALIFAGVSSITANATSTIALLPGSIAGVAGYRRVLPAAWKWIKIFTPVSLLGGFLGGVLLTRTPESVFDRLVPFLILFATVLFSAHAFFARIFRLEKRQAEKGVSVQWLIGAVVFQFAVSVYGGYFGAGIGILMLASLGILGFENIHEMNAVKGVLAFMINVVAAAYFIFSGLVDWPAGLIVAAGGIMGGYSGAHFAQKIRQETVRHLITLAGLLITAVMFYQQLKSR
jgi:uncharacterized protein